MTYLFKRIPFKEPFGLNTLDKDQGERGSSPVELFTRGQRTSALSSLEPPPPPHTHTFPTLRWVRVFLSKGLWLNVSLVVYSKCQSHLEACFHLTSISNRDQVASYEGFSQHFTCNDCIFSGVLLKQYDYEFGWWATILYNVSSLRFWRIGCKWVSVHALLSHSCMCVSSTSHCHFGTNNCFWAQCWRSLSSRTTKWRP